MTRSTASMTRGVLNVGMAITLGFDAMPQLTHGSNLSPHFRRGATNRTTHAPVGATTRASLRSFVAGLWCCTSMLVSVGERTRLLRGTTAPLGWDPANFLVAEAGATLYDARRRRVAPSSPGRRAVSSSTFWRAQASSSCRRSSPV